MAIAGLKPTVNAWRETKEALDAQIADAAQNGDPDLTLSRLLMARDAYTDIAESVKMIPRYAILRRLFGAYAAQRDVILETVSAEQFDEIERLNEQVRDLKLKLSCKKDELRKANGKVTRLHDENQHLEATNSINLREWHKSMDRVDAARRAHADTKGAFDTYMALLIKRMYNDGYSTLHIYDMLPIPPNQSELSKAEWLGYIREVTGE